MKTFTAVTYNVLAQSYVHADRYPLCPREALDPERRRALLLERVTRLDADLLCLQEVEPAVHDDLCVRLDATHHKGYVPRGPRPEGVAVFARRGLFTWEGNHELRFRANRPGEENVALVARLGFDGQPLHVACAHLDWQPDSTPPGEHTGRLQMLELTAHREAASDDATWIFAGDFNAISQSSVLEVAYSHGMSESCRSQRPWDTCAINGRPRKIDYLLYSSGRLVPRPGVLPKLTRDSVLPSATEPSDHLPLKVEFTL